MRLRLSISILVTLYAAVGLCQLKINGSISPSSRWSNKMLIFRMDRIGLSRPMLVDSISMNEDGSFQYQFQDDPQGILYKFQQVPRNQFITQVTDDNWFFISSEERGEISLTAHSDSLFSSLRIQNGNLNNKLLVYRDMQIPLQRVTKILQDSILRYPARAESFKEKYLPLAMDEVSNAKNKIISMLDTCRNQSFLLMGMHHLYMASFGQVDPKIFEKYIARVDGSKSLLAKNVKFSLLKNETSRLGIAFTGATLQDREGKTVKITDIHSEYKVIDFWASWCGPCRQANKNQLPKLNAFLKENKIPLIGISIDKNKLRWKEALRKDSTSWMQLIELSPELSTLVHVEGIPLYLVLDENNKVIYEGNVLLLIERFIKAKITEKR